MGRMHGIQKPAPNGHVEFKASAVRPETDLKLDRKSGAGCRIRTRDLRFTKPLLYQLS